MRSALITLLCLAVTLLVQESCQVSSLYCPCLKISSGVLPIARIKSYTTQRASICHVDAIVFKTVRGKTFCADPTKTWVIDIVEHLDKNEPAPRNKTTTQSTISTASTLSTTKDKLNADWSGQDELQTELNEYITITGRSFCPCLKTAEVVMNEDDIRRYKIHNADVCHVDTVEFETVQGFTFCSYLDDSWVKKVMQFVDNIKEANETSEHLLNYTGPPLNTSFWDEQDELEENDNVTESTSPNLYKNVKFCL